MLSKRERTIAIVTGAALGLGALSYVYDWVQGSFDDLDQQRAALLQAKTNAMAALRQDQQATRQWKEFKKHGLSQDASTAESDLLNALGGFAADANLPLSIRTDRTVPNLGLHDMAFEATADGSMRAIADLLYRVETAATPVRVRELHLSTKKEGTDSLAVQLRISTVWDDPNAGKGTVSPAPPGAPGAPGAKEDQP